MKWKVLAFALVAMLATGAVVRRLASQTHAETAPAGLIKKVTAPVEPPFDPEQDTADMMHAMEASGFLPSSPLKQGTEQLFDAWRRAAAPELSAHVEFEDVTCFKSGCYMRARYESADQLEAMTLNFYKSTLFGDFPANAARSAPLVAKQPASHAVSAVWFITLP